MPFAHPILFLGARIGRSWTIEDWNTVSECSFCGFGVMVDYKTISLVQYSRSISI
ncbi:Tubulin beta chain [Psidium guajava]|nr:Tubulin beta chain [Psidium guajava]